MSWLDQGQQLQDKAAMKGCNSCNTARLPDEDIFIVPGEGQKWSGA